MKSHLIYLNETDGDIIIETVDNKGVHSYTLSIFDANKGQKIYIENYDYRSDTDEAIIYLELHNEENLYYISNCNEIIYYYLIRAMITSGSDEANINRNEVNCFLFSIGTGNLTLIFLS